MKNHLHLLHHLMKNKNNKAKRKMKRARRSKVFETVISTVLKGSAFIIALMSLILPWSLRSILSRFLMDVIDFVMNHSTTFLRLGVKVRWKK